MQSISKGVMVSDAIPPEYRNIISRLKSISMVTKDTALREAIDNQLYNSMGHFFKNFTEDASPRISLQIQFALDSDDVFKDKLADLHESYLDGAMKRIQEAEQWYRLGFITELTNWVEGKSDAAGLPDIIAKTKGETGKFSQFFARNEFQLFNKALTEASFKQAGVKKARWISVGDQRVSTNHRLLHGNVFEIDNLPTAWKAKNGQILNVAKEIKRPLCRCCLLPVFED
jgi:SPP1 gp7 family putative phage head morphogenesis protein